MIQQIWDKRVVTQIYIDQKDVADDCLPFPLIMEMSWNHYVGIYYEEIVAFFSSYVVYPFSREEVYLTLEGRGDRLDGTEVVGTLVTMGNERLKQPLRFVCHFRSSVVVPSIEIKKHFKYSQKASTAIRNPKLGPSLMTLHMSVDDVQKMYQSFVKNDLKEFLGSTDFQGGSKLGFGFLLSKTEKVSLRIVGKEFLIERGVEKVLALGKVLAEVFDTAECKQQDSLQNKQQKPNEQVQTQPTSDQKTTQQVSNVPQQSKEDCTRYNYIFEKYNFYMHGVKITRGQYPISFFDKYCHPDGFLYIFFKETN